MTQLLHVLALAALTVLSVLSLDAHLAGVLADDISDCIEGSVDSRLRGCSRIIKSGRINGKPISKEKLAYTLSLRGHLYVDNGQFDRAIADYDKTIKLEPKDLFHYSSRGRAYVKKGQFDRAIADYDTTIKLNPKYAWTYGDRGVAYEKLGQRDKAITDFRKALELRPGDRVATSGLKRLGVTP